MKVLIFETEDEAKEQGARRLIRKVQQAPDCVLGLATGGTMEAVYAHLVSLTRQDGVSWSKVTTFNLDEYWGVPPESPASYRRYMNTHLFDHVDVDAAATHLPVTVGCSPEEAAEAYESAIAAAGGIDLQLLGIGENGHIGFNEPISSLSSKTRIKTLTEATRQANRRFFDRLEDVPKYALTVGIGTIMRSEECVLLATGSRKAAAVRAMIEGPVSAVCPASALQFHPNTTIIIDAAAADELELKDYYLHVHPGGEESDFSDG